VASASRGMPVYTSAFDATH